MTQKIGEKRIKKKKFGDLEVKLEEQDFHLSTIHYDAVGVYLKGILTNRDKNSYVLFDRQVRGTGRYGDDFNHWYREIDNIEEKEEKIYVTLNSGLLRDTYSFDKESKNVRLENTINLEEIKKNNEIKNIFENFKGKPLSEITKEFGKIVAKKDKTVGTKSPEIIKIVVNEESEKGLVALGKYYSGNDPAVKKVEMYVITPDCRFQKLDDILLQRYQRPKDSSTYFRVKNLELFENRVKLNGNVILKRYGHSGEELDFFTKELEINDNYKQIEEFFR